MWKIWVNPTRNPIDSTRPVWPRLPIWRSSGSPIFVLFLSLKSSCNLLSKDTYFVPFGAAIERIFQRNVGWYSVEICKDDFLPILCAIRRWSWQAICSKMLTIDHTSWKYLLYASSMAKKKYLFFLRKYTLKNQFWTSQMIF